MEINCGSSVDHQDINRYVNECSCSNCRTVTQKARVIVTEAESWARKNFQITCYGDHFPYVFYSGSRCHQVVVQVSGGELRVKTNITSWTEWLQAVVRRKWSDFVDAAISIAGLVVGRVSGVGIFFVVLCSKLLRLSEHSYRTENIQEKVKRQWDSS